MVYAARSKRVVSGHCEFDSHRPYQKIYVFCFAICENVCDHEFRLCCLHCQPASRTPPINRPDRVRTPSWVQGKQENRPIVSQDPGAYKVPGFFAFVLTDFKTFRDSQAARQRTVNAPIAGSNPALGARSLTMLAVSEAASRDSLKVECLVRIQDGQP